MYTQCPDCDTAFRVTAEVLKQAAGKVRCGGCGHAFNALAYLSEQKPEKKAEDPPEPSLPELKPEPLELEPEPEPAPEAELPRSISAEQSAALLKTLDQLAGSDIRIEDTGVEWLVVDEEKKEGVLDVFQAPGKTELDAELPADSGEAVLDELLEEAPTPVDEFLTATPNDVEAGEIFEEAEEPVEVRTSVDELRFDDNTPLPEDFDFNEPAIEAKADEKQPEAEQPEPQEPEDLQVDLAFGDSDDWESLLDEVEPQPEPVPEPEIEAEGESLEADPEPKIDDEPPDMDTQFAIQAEAMGIDLSGVQDTNEDEGPDGELDDLDLETLLSDSQDSDEPAADENDELVDSLVLDLAEADEAIEASTSNELESLGIDEFEQDEAVEEQDEKEVEVPPLSEEEQTINMQIDQDLMAMAIEDKDGFASTIVKGSIEEIVEEERAAEGAASSKQWPYAKGLSDEEESQLFETVILEGESVRHGPPQDEQDTDASIDDLFDPIRADTRDEGNKGVRGGRRKTDPPSWGLIAAAVFLGLVLVVQYLHQSRESLAIYPAFNKTFGPFYRMIGRPLTPTWNVAGWNFEWSSGNFNDTGELLTIASRIGNRSGGPLPYPLISVSLTDRFEETIGNKVLEPIEYLVDDLDPREAVAPGNSFSAAITINTPSAEATGFKLNVCYRIDGRQLRCNMQDFK